MFTRDLLDCRHFKAADNTLICELLHPAREGIDLPYSIAHAILEPGKESLPHRLKESSEVYFILEGEALMTIEAEQSRVGPGRVILIPPGFCQQIRNIGSDDLKFLCIVYPYWRREDDEVRW
jgi:mannose-6-phosphate isomerase-like protein (cupin superfamily)